MFWNDLISLLDNYTVVKKSAAPGQDLVHAVWLNDPSMLLDPFAIYFVHPDTLATLKLPKEKPFSFVVSGPVDSCLFELAELANLCLIEKAENFHACFQIAFDAISALELARTNVMSIYHMVASGTTMNQIAEKTAEIFQAPVTIIDTTYTIIGYSQNFISRVATLNDDTSRGYLPMRVQEFMRTHETTNPHQIQQKTQYFELKEDGDVVGNYLTFIYINNIRVGSFSVITNNEHIPEYMMALLPEIAFAISLEMQKSSYYLLNKNNLYGRFFEQLQAENLPDNDSELMLRMHIFGYNLLKYRFLIYADISQFFFTSSELTAFADRLHALISNNIYTIRENSILFLSSAESPDLSTVLQEQELSCFLHNSNVKIGVSSGFISFEMFKTCISEAVSAVSIGNRISPDKNIYTYDECRTFDIIGLLSASEPLSKFIFPPLMELIGQDQLHGTNLTYTLYLYLKYPHQISEICSRLYIHRNTLYYRLDKIKDILHCELHSSEAIREISFSFNILKFQNRFDSLCKSNMPSKS